MFFRWECPHCCNIFFHRTFDSSNVFRNADTVGTISEHTVWIIDSVTGKVRGFWGKNMWVVFLEKLGSFVECLLGIMLRLSVWVIFFYFIVGFICPMDWQLIMKTTCGLLMLLVIRLVYMLSVWRLILSWRAIG